MLQPMRPNSKVYQAGEIKGDRATVREDNFVQQEKTGFKNM